MFEELKANRYERILRNANFDGKLPLVLAGGSRSLRVSWKKSTAQRYIATIVAAGVVAPVVFLYVWWLLLDAQSKGVRKLFFLARDGQIFWKVASTLVDVWGLDVEPVYLHCSRESLLLPAFSKLGDFERGWIIWGYRSEISLGEVCRRVKISADEIRPLAVSCGLSAYIEDPDQVIALQDKPALMALVDSPDFSEMVHSKSAPLFELALGYLKSQGFAGSVGVVDTGWECSSQYALSSILDMGGSYPSVGVSGYYLGVNRKAHVYRDDSLNGFLFDWRGGQRTWRHYNHICLEMLFSSDEGRTLGYARDCNDIKPILAQGGTSEFAQLISLHHEISVDYAQRMAEFLHFESLPSNSFRVCRNLVKEFVCNPTGNESALYGEWPMACEVRERDVQRVAPPLTLGGFVQCVLGWRKIQGYWPQASLVRGHLCLLARCYNVFLNFNLLSWYRRTFLKY